MKTKKKSSLEVLIDQYNEKETKGNLGNTLLKSTVDITGSVAGTGIASLSGDKSLLVGAAIIALGHYINDESGLLRIAGASTIGYGIAKANEFKTNPELATLSQRTSAWKNDLLTSFYLNWKKETGQEKVKEVIEPSETKEEPKQEKNKSDE